MRPGLRGPSWAGPARVEGLRRSARGARGPSGSVPVRNWGAPTAADPRGGRGGWGLGKPDRTVGPTARLSGAGTPGPTYDDGFPKAPPPPPPPPPGRTGRTTTRGARVSAPPRRDFPPPTLPRPPSLRVGRVRGQ